MREGSSHSNDRRPVAAGRFYSASPEVLRSDLNSLFSKVSEHQSHQGLRAIISPHAGYVFSGVVAAAAFASVPPDKKFSNIFVIGSSHRASFNGASVYDEGDFLTPLGRVPVNHEIAVVLKKESELFRYKAAVHNDEHSIEVQLPFIQYRFGNPPPVVPVLIGTCDIAAIQSVAATLKPWFTSDNLFIISTDFSHYPSYTDAKEADRVTAEAILSGNPDELNKTLQQFKKAEIKGLSTNMCGWAAGLALMYLTAGEKSLRYHHLMYRNSGDSQYGNKSGVVGYHSFIVADDSGMADDSALAKEKGMTEDAQVNHDVAEALHAGLAEKLSHDEGPVDDAEQSEDAFLITDDDRITLFKIARDSIEAGLKAGTGNPLRYHKGSKASGSGLRNRYGEGSEATGSGHCNRLAEGSGAREIDQGIRGAQGSETILKSGGVFVTLYLNGELRGCIGRLGSSEPICSNVYEMAFSAAFSDPRYAALTVEEYKSTEIEISVISPLKRIYSKDEVVIGKHGLYIRKEGRSGVMLPQVASERGWTVEQFLQHTARYKAGIDKDGWKDAELSVFETLILKEDRSLGTIINKQ